MRTTVDLADDVLAAAKEIARLRGDGLGRVLSDLARRGLQPSSALKMEEQDGIPVFVHDPSPIPVTPDLIRQILDSDNQG